MTLPMIPLSGRIEQDLYEWFIGLDFPGAQTNSDKLREALRELRRQQSSSADVISAQSWLHSMTDPLRRCLSTLERNHRTHSETMAALIDHVEFLAAALLAARPRNTKEAAALEDQMVRRAMTMTEALLRQALLPAATAFDTDVLQRHAGRVIELAALIHQNRKGENHG